MASVPNFCAECGSPIRYLRVPFRHDPNTGEATAYRDVWVCEKHASFSSDIINRHYRKSLVFTNRSGIGVTLDYIFQS